VEEGCSLTQLFSRLPPRFGKAGLIDEFPRDTALAIIRRFTPGDPKAVGAELSEYFSAELGFGAITDINTLDGLRLRFDNGDVAHIRPSGNAPQLRIYAVADTESRAQAIVAMALEEPDGLLRRLSRVVD
jgi:phosphomannomutase